MKKFILGLVFALGLLACVVVETTEKNIIEVVQYEWWSLKQANLFITEDTCFYIVKKYLKIETTDKEEIRRLVDVPWLANKSSYTAAMGVVPVT